MARGIQGTFEGKVFVVTGGGTGIGAATAIACAEIGMDVLLVGRRREPLERVAARIEGLGRRGVVLPMDVATFNAIVDLTAGGALAESPSIDRLCEFVAGSQFLEVLLVELKPTSTPGRDHVLMVATASLNARAGAPRGGCRVPTRRDAPRALQQRGRATHNAGRSARSLARGGGRRFGGAALH